MYSQADVVFISPIGSEKLTKMIKNYAEYKLKNEEFYSERRSLTERYKSYHPKDISAIKVGWQSRDNQYSGFEFATKFDSIDWTAVKSVLDIGCGYGNLVEYLRQEKNFQGEYTGIEIIPEFLEAAQKLYGDDSRNKFILSDFLEYEWHQQKFDIVIALGVISLNLDQPDFYGEKTDSYTKKTISLMINLTKMGMSIYFANAFHVPILQRYMNLDLACYNPSDIQEMIENATERQYKSLVIESYPEEDNVETIARVSFV
jgi:SAM-dependent methyltransferase